MPHEKTIGKPDVGNPHVRFERGRQETERDCHRASGLPMSDVAKMYVREVAVGMTIFVCLILMAYFTMRGAYAAYKAGINRKPGYSFRTAANPQSLLFRDAPYTDEGKKWCATFQRCNFGWIAVFAIFWIVSWIGSGR